MDRQFATLMTDGKLTLPLDIQTAVGVRPGSQLEISVRDGDIVLHPASADLFTSLRGIFAGQPSLEDELIAMRREEEAHLRRKEQEWG